MELNSIKTNNIDYVILQIVPAPQGWYAKVINGKEEKHHPIICWGLILVKDPDLEKKSIEGFVFQQEKQILPAIAVNGFERYIYEPKKQPNDFCSILPSSNEIKQDYYGINGRPVPEIDPEKFRASYELYVNILSTPTDPTNCLTELVKELAALDATDEILSESEIEAFNYRILIIEEFDILVADGCIWNAIATYPLVYGKWPTLEEFMNFVELKASGE